MCAESTVPVVISLAEDATGARHFRLDQLRATSGWAILAGRQLWIWATGLRPLQAATPMDPYTYEVWMAAASGDTTSLGAVGPAPGGIALGTFHLPDGACPAAVLVTAQARGNVHPSAVVLAGRLPAPATAPAAAPALPPASTPPGPAPAATPTPAAAAPAPEAPAPVPPEGDPFPAPEDAVSPAAADVPMAPLVGAEAPPPAPAAAPPTPTAGTAAAGTTGAGAPGQAPPGCIALNATEVPLEPHGSAVPGALATAHLDFVRGGLLLTARNLPRPEDLGESAQTGRAYNAYRAWLQSSATHETHAVGIAGRVWEGTYRIQVREGLHLRRFDTILITAEDRAGSAGHPAGMLVLAGRYRWYQPRG